jgi:hypothetical protein
MDVTLHKVDREKEGWFITIKANLDPSVDREALEKIEDWEVSFQKDYVFLKNFFDRSEPWEDEPLEEMVKAAILEVEWKLERIKGH